MLLYKDFAIVQGFNRASRQQLKLVIEVRRFLAIGHYFCFEFIKSMLKS